MLNMIKIGKIISEQRRKLNLTQMEVADKLGVTFQAVSSWERGQTMPDITKLDELSKIFNISIDELLDNQNGTNIIQRIIKNESNIKVNSVDEFIEIAPIIKPENSEVLAKEIMDKKTISLKELTSLAPYLDEETLSEFAKNTSTGDLNDLAPIAPYLSEECLVELIEKSVNKRNSFDEIMSLIPFIETENLEKIVFKVRENNLDINVIVPVAPFMDDKTLMKIVVEEIEKGNFGGVVVLAPYLGSDELNKLIKEKFSLLGTEI